MVINSAADPDPVGSKTFKPGRIWILLNPDPIRIWTSDKKICAIFAKFSYHLKIVSVVFDYIRYMFPSKILNTLKKSCSSSIMYTKNFQ